MMTYKLYYAAESASMGIRLILEELGMPYELIQSTTDKDVQRPPEQVLINPNGWLPVLVWDEGHYTGRNIRESRGFCYLL